MIIQQNWGTNNLLFKKILFKIYLSFLYFLFIDLTIQVGDRQKEALDAMQRLPIIINKVASTREKLRRVEAALGKAVNEAESARRMSGEAREIAGNIDQVQRSEKEWLWLS